MKRIRSKSGFTMIEVLIVVAVIAVLAAVAIPQYTRFLAKTRRTEGILILTAIHRSQTAYFAQHDRFVAAADFQDFLRMTGLELASVTRFYQESGTAIWSPLATEYHAITKGDLDSDPAEDWLCISETSVPACGILNAPSGVVLVMPGHDDVLQ